MVNRCASWGLIAWLSSAAPALAAPPASAPKPRDYALEAVLAGHLAGYLSAEHEDSALLGGTALVRGGPFEGGAEMNIGGPFFDNSVFNTSLLAGLGLQLDAGPRLDLLGILGIDMYRSSGGFLSDDPGASAALGYAGARGGVSYRFAARGSGHFLLGAFVSYERDFEHVTKRYSYLSENWFSGETSRVEAERTFGDERIAIAAMVGVTFDMLPR